MKNLNFGDADSVGFFQMRVGIWNQGAYAGYPDKPELQVKWFLDQAEAVKKPRVAAGKPIDDPNQFGEWIADVERPAEQYRGRYQTKLDEANGLLGKRRDARRAAARGRRGRRTGPPRRGRGRGAAAQAGTRSASSAVTAEDAAKAAGPKQGDELSLHGSPLRARRARSRRPPAAPAVVADAATATARRLEQPRRRGAGGRARRELAKGVHEAGVNTGKQVDKYLAAAGVGARQPVVRELRDLVAGAGRPQDGGQRLGRGADVGAQRRGRDQRPPGRQRRRRAPRRHRLPTTGAARRTSAPTATSASWPATSRAASSPRWRATTRTRS